MDTLGSRQPPEPTDGGEVVVPLVMVDLAARMALGKERYGTELRSHNGRNALLDLYQELLDAVIYCRQLLMEETDEEVQR